MTIPAPATALPILRDGSFIYALNEQGTNYFFASVQCGHTNDDKRTPEKECEEIAAYLERACNSFPALVAALQEAEHALESARAFILEKHGAINRHRDETLTQTRAALSLALGEQ